MTKTCLAYQRNNSQQRDNSQEGKNAEINESLYHSAAAVNLIIKTNGWRYIHSFVNVTQKANVAIVSCKTIREK